MYEKMFTGSEDQDTGIFGGHYSSYLTLSEYEGYEEK